MTGFIQQIYHYILPHETRLWVYKLRNPEHFRRMRSVINPSPKGNFSLKPYDENQCIFIHVTKTAGTSVSRSLFGYLPYHHTALDYRVIYGKKTFNQYFKFAFVRNPWDRLHSSYRYLKAGGWNENDRAWAEKHISQFENFEIFVKNWLTEKNIEKHVHFWPQKRFLCDRSSTILVDHLAYFETINDDYETIRRKLSTGSPIAHHNANPGSSYRDAYNDETQAIVADIYADDIRLFGYDFDGIKKRTVTNI